MIYFKHSNRVPSGSSPDQLWKTSMTTRDGCSQTRLGSSSFLVLNLICFHFQDPCKMGRPSQLQMRWLLPSWISPSKNIVKLNYCKVKILHSWNIAKLKYCKVEILQSKNIVKLKYRQVRISPNKNIAK